MDALLHVLIPFGFLILLGLLLRLVACLNTTLHEAGHMIAWLFATKEKVTVYLGSTGNQEKSWHIRLGRVDFWIRRNLLLWWGGLCKGNHRMTVGWRAAVVLAGPLASFIVCISMIFFLRAIEGQGAWAPVAYIVCALTLISFIANLIPSRKSFLIETGDRILNDGGQLLKIWKYRTVPVGFFYAMDHFNEENYPKAAEQFTIIIAEGCKMPEVFRIAVLAQLSAKSYDAAESLQSEMQSLGIDENDADRELKGALLICKRDFLSAIDHLSATLEKDGPAIVNFVNLGYALINVGRFEEAIPHLDKAIEIDETFAIAYSNRCYAYLQTGKLDLGKADLDRATELDPDPNHGYLHLNLGVYHLHFGNLEGAELEFEMAKEKEPEIPVLDAWFQQLRRLKEQSGQTVVMGN